MKRFISSFLVLAALIGLGTVVVKAAELQPIAFPFIGRWQPSEDPVLLDDYGLQDIQNLRKSGKHFKGISGHTIINSTSISAAPFFLNGFHFHKDQPSESHILVVAADTATPTASYLYRNTTAVPGAGDFLDSVLHTDASGGLGTGRFCPAPQGNMVYCNGAETLIWGGSEIEATAVIASTNSLSGTSSTLTNAKDYSDQLRNTERTADQVAILGSVIDSYTKLLLYSDGTDGSTIIPCAVSTTRTITAHGSAQIDTAQVKYGTGSILYSSASTDSISAADDANWNLANGDFTIDAWIRPSTFISSASTTLIDVSSLMTSNTTPAPYVAWALNTPEAWKAFDAANTAQYLGDWGHSRGATFWPEPIRFDFGLGNAKISTKYIIKGSGVYSPKSWTFQGSNDNTTYTTLDTQTNITGWGASEEKTYTFANTTAYRYYQLYVTAGNNDDYLVIQQLKIYAPDYADTTILSQSSTGNIGWGLYASGNALTLSYSTDGSTALEKSVSWTPLLNTWQHVAVSRNDANLRFFVNGTQQGATQDLTGITFSNSTALLESGNSFNGWIDELQLAKGIARWTSDFTPPVAAYQNGTPYWVAGFTRPLQGVKFYIDTPNNIASVLTVKEWNGTDWTSLSVTDNTSSGGISLAQTGTVTWPSTVDSSKQKYLQGLPIYWYQFYLNAGSATIYYVTADAPMQTIKNIWNGRNSYVSSCLKWNGANYIDYTDAVNDDTDLTYLDVSSLSTAHYFVVGFTEPMQGLEFSLVAAQENTTASTQMTISYGNGLGWAAVTGLSDGSATSTTSLSKTGVASFQGVSPGIEFETTIAAAVPLYYYKVNFAAGLDASTQIAEIRGIAAPKPIPAYAFGETFQNRLFLFSQKAGIKNKAIYSVDNSPDLFNGPDSGTLYIGENTEIVAAKSVYNVFGNTAYDQLIIGKKNEIYRLSGDSPYTWNVKRISANIGVIAPLSMVSCEVSGKEEDTRTQVIVWQGDKGFYMTDGSLVIPISDDIKCYFDPNDSRYIPTARRSKTVAWYDPLTRVYKALISSGSGQTYHNIELEYSLLTKEWTKIYRVNASGADPLQCGFQVFDTDGIGYTYGGNKTGFLYRLENGATFAGTAIPQYLQTKDLILDNTAPMFRKSSVKYLRTAVKKKPAASGGGTIAVSHYGDQVLSVNGTSNQVVPSAFSMATGPYNTQSCALGPALYHSFKFVTSDTTASDGMELIGLGFYVEPHTAMR